MPIQSMTGLLLELTVDDSPGGRLRFGVMVSLCSISPSSRMCESVSFITWLACQVVTSLYVDRHENKFT